MKHLISLILLVFCSIEIFAQQDSISKKTNETTEEYYKQQNNYQSKPEKIKSSGDNFLTFNFGINNPNGLIGLGWENAIDDRNAIWLGTGLGMWGLKTAVNYRYVLRGSSQEGIMLYFGGSGSAGIKNEFSFSATNSRNKMETYTIKMKPAFTLDAGILFLAGVGSRSRFEFTLGFQSSISDNPYTVSPKSPALSRDAISFLHLIRPGGITASVSFGIGM